MSSTRWQSVSVLRRSAVTFACGFAFRQLVVVKTKAVLVHVNAAARCEHWGGRWASPRSVCLQGYRRAGAIPHHHNGVLQRSHGRSAARAVRLQQRARPAGGTALQLAECRCGAGRWALGGRRDSVRAHAPSPRRTARADVPGCAETALLYLSLPIRTGLLTVA